MSRHYSQYHLPLTNCLDTHLSPRKSMVNHDQTASSTQCDVCKDILLNPAIVRFLSLSHPPEKPSSEGQHNPPGPAKKRVAKIVLKETFHQLLGR
jgi:hypothetical protein